MFPVTDSFIFKITSTCNLNCTYCYMFNKGDNSFLNRPKVMEIDIAFIAVRKIIKYAEKHHIKNISIVLHGGEPLLAGYAWFEKFLKYVKNITPSNLNVAILIQTNGTLLDMKWIRILNLYGVGLGLSLDGPAKWNDINRIDHKGNGSYEKVKKSIELLLSLGDNSPGCGVLIVANPEYPSQEIYKHFIELGINNMDFLWPDYHHDDPSPWKKGALAKYYIDLFDIWFNQENYKVKIRWFEEAIRLLLGDKCKTRGLGLGLSPVTDIVIESDGSIEPADTLRACSNGMTRVGLNIRNHEIESIYDNELFQQGLTNIDELPAKCKNCKAYEICGGGKFTHRWSKENKFSNPSVHCSDLLTTLEHISMKINELTKRTGT
ncbi:radical SAM protein [Bacillus cereus]|nr:radical SAM protein [Bacillus cereus]